MSRDPEVPRKPRKARRPFREDTPRPPDTMTGLGYLEGKEVSVLADGLDTAAAIASFKATIAYGLATLLGLLLASLWVGSAVGTAAALLALATAYLAQSCYTRQHNRWGWLLQTLSIASATFGLLALVLPVALG